MGEAPLCTRYPRLFDICEDSDALVAQVLLPTGCRIIFRRNFGEKEMSQWDHMTEELDRVDLTLQ